VEAQTKIRELYDKCVKRDKEYAELYFEDKVKSKLENRKQVFKNKKELMMQEVQAFIKHYNQIHIKLLLKQEELHKVELEVSHMQLALKVTKPEEDLVAALTIEIAEITNKKDMEGLYSLQLNQMIDRNKEDLMAMLLPI
jgi:hypothetical protein